MNSTDPEAPYFAAWNGDGANGAYGFSKFTVSDTQITAEFVRSTEGNFTDRFTIADSSAGTVPPTPTPTEPPFPAGQTLAFTPVADAYVDSSLPDSHFGSYTHFSVDASPVQESYLKFELAGLSGTISSAKLRLYVPSVAYWGSEGGGSVAKMSNTTWSEASVTYNTRPAIDGPTLATLGAVNAGQWYELDVTPAVTGNGTLSLGMKSSSSNGAHYASRESGAFAPQLQVTMR
jgi:hypothetical protein